HVGAERMALPGGGSIHRREVVLNPEPPGPRAPPANDYISDPDSRPVEVAVVVQQRTAIDELVEQRALGGSRHALGADHGRAGSAKVIGGDGNDIRILADEDALAGQVLPAELMPQ